MPKTHKTITVNQCCAVCKYADEIKGRIICGLDYEGKGHTDWCDEFETNPQLLEDS